MKRRLQPRAAQAEQSSRSVNSPYLTSHEAIGYLRLGSLSALYSHIRENKLPVCRVGRELRFDTRELDAWMRGFGSAIAQSRSLRKVS